MSVGSMKFGKRHEILTCSKDEAVCVSNTSNKLDRLHKINYIL